MMQLDNRKATNIESEQRSDDESNFRILAITSQSTSAITPATRAPTTPNACFFCSAADLEVDALVAEVAEVVELVLTVEDVPVTVPVPVEECAVEVELSGAVEVPELVVDSEGIDRH
jgi:hypothetical protein